MLAVYLGSDGFLPVFRSAIITRIFDQDVQRYPYQPGMALSYKAFDIVWFLRDFYMQLDITLTCKKRLPCSQEFQDCFDYVGTTKKFDDQYDSSKNAKMATNF